MNTETKLAQIRAFTGCPEFPDIYSLGELFHPNGCGPCLHPWLSWLIPDWLPGLGSFQAACDLHDYRYFIGGTEADRRRADRELKAFMCWLVRESNWFVRRWMFRIATVYWGSVWYGGTRAFNYTLTLTKSTPSYPSVVVTHTRL